MKNSQVPKNVEEFIRKYVKLCKPNNVHICDGSENEAKNLIDLMIKMGTLSPLKKFNNCFLARTDPDDVARVESKTFICTNRKRDTVPEPLSSSLVNWMDPSIMRSEMNDRFDGCMEGRTMYVIPFCMGPVGSPLSEIGIQITDSPYVVCSMRIMTRMGYDVLKHMYQNDPVSPKFVPALHSQGGLIKPKYPSWPCDPARTLVAHFPDSREIISFGSNYGGNSLLGKKCFALRIASCIAKDEGWLAEHMLILSLTNPQGQKIYVAAAFPSACGKTNLAMMNCSLPGWKVKCVGDDIAWMRYVTKNGITQLRAINPEFGFFGVAPGTSTNTNKVAMQIINKDTIFTNVASTSDGGVYWEGLSDVDPTDKTITSWLNKEWSLNSSSQAAHSNSRFCSPITNCPELDEEWQNPEGVPISAILFGGRRPQGVPLVYEAFDWEHGVFIGSSMRSEGTSASVEASGSKKILNDPFAMRPFFGYNPGRYLKHWLNIGKKPDCSLPKVFHVNWFRKNEQGKFLWPGFGENSRVLKWIFERCTSKNDKNIKRTPIGYLPTNNSFDLTGLNQQIDLNQLFDVSIDFWNNEVNELNDFYNKQFGSDLPIEIKEQLDNLKTRLNF